MNSVIVMLGNLYCPTHCFVTVTRFIRTDSSLAIWYEFESHYCLKGIKEVVVLLATKWSIDESTELRCLSLQPKNINEPNETFVRGVMFDLLFSVNPFGTKEFIQSFIIYTVSKCNVKLDLSFFIAAT